MFKSANVLVCVSTGMSLAWLAAYTRVSYPIAFALAVVSAVTYLALLRAAGRQSPNKFLMYACAYCALLTAVCLNARDSHDVWSYIMYGRTIAQHHSNPYSQPPQTFTDDPFLSYVAQGWRHVPSVYGPAFSSMSAAITFVASDNRFMARALHQMLVAIFVFAGAVIAERAYNYRNAVAYLCLCPPMFVTVNGGHNDAIALALAAFAIAVLPRSWVTCTDFAHKRAPAAHKRAFVAGIIGALAICTKAIAIVPLACAIVWMVLHNQYKRAATAIVPASIACVLMYWVAGGTNALRPLSQVGSATSRASLWSLPIWLMKQGQIEISKPIRVVVLLGLVILLLYVSRTVWLGADSPIEIAAIGTLSFVAFSPYVLAWYATGAMTIAVLSSSSRIRATAVVISTLLMFAYVTPAGVAQNPVSSALSALAIPAACVLVYFVFRNNIRLNNVVENTFGK